MTVTRLASLAVLATLAAGLQGCGLATVPIYEGPPRPVKDIAVVSAMAGYPERHIGMITMQVDGKDVDHTRTSEFHLPPGPHTMSVRVQNNLRVGGGGPGVSVQWNEATIPVPLVAEAGHSYIPDVKIDGGQVTGFYRDMGTDFRQECMPLRRMAVMYGGTADGKRAGCPE